MREQLGRPMNPVVEDGADSVTSSYALALGRPHFQIKPYSQVRGEHFDAAHVGDTGLPRTTLSFPDTRVTVQPPAADPLAWPGVWFMGYTGPCLRSGLGSCAAFPRLHRFCRSVGRSVGLGEDFCCTCFEAREDHYVKQTLTFRDDLTFSGVAHNCFEVSRRRCLISRCREGNVQSSE